MLQWILNSTIFPCADNLEWGKTKFVFAKYIKGKNSPHYYEVNKLEYDENVDLEL